MDGSSWFGSNLTLRMHLREISQLMDSYPQLILNITKVFGPPKAYKWRHCHGEQGENNKQNHFHFDREYFEKGVGQGVLGEVVSTPSMFLSTILSIFVDGFFSI